MKRVYRMTVLSGCISAMFAPLPGAAQTAPVTDVASIETIVVTAQKRKETLQEVPVSVTALTPQMLQSLNVVNVSDLQIAVPNVLISTSAGSQGTLMAYIRGIGTADPIFSQDPAIGLYIDDVYLTRSHGANKDFFDVERVEVLRGPQGTLYGSNSPGGAIKIVTAKPDLTGGFSGKVEASVGNFKSNTVNAVVNLPISEASTAARLAVQTGRHDGYQTNLADGSKTQTLNYTNARVHWLTKLNDNWELLLSADENRQNTTPQGGVNFRDATPFGPNMGNDITGAPGFNAQDTASEMKYRYDNENNGGLVANLRGKIGNADFRSLTAYRHLANDINQDVDGTIYNYFKLQQILRNKQYTQEFNLNGDTGSINWLVGAYFLREETEFTWNPKFWRELVPYGVDIPAQHQRYDQTKNSWALFTQETWRATDRLSLSAGLRWTNEKKDYHVRGFDTIGDTDFGTPAGTQIAGFDVRRSKTWSAPQWRVATDYKLSADALVFASAARGFRSGGFAGDVDSAAAAANKPPFEPEYLTTVELGTKTEWFNHKLRVNVTYFQNEYKNQQVITNDATATGFVFNETVFDSKMHGLEIETTLRPTKALRLFGNLATMNGSTSSPIYLLTPNAKYQYTVGFDFTQPTSTGLSWFVGANYFRTSKVDLDYDHAPTKLAPAHGNLGARAGVSDGKGRWKLELIGNNLRNEHWPLLGFDIDPVHGGLPALFSVRYPNDPRTVQLKLTLNY